MTTIALFGAAGKIGTRIANRLREPQLLRPCRPRDLQAAAQREVAGHVDRQACQWQQHRHDDQRVPDHVAAARRPRSQWTGVRRQDSERISRRVGQPLAKLQRK